MGEIARATQQVAQAQDRERTFRDLVVGQIPAMKQLLPDGADAARMAQIAMECFRKNPRLGECSPDSVRWCLIRCAAMGLEPSDVDNMGNVYLIPRKGQCTFQLGYQGMLTLMRRSGMYDSLVARAVHEGDVFEYSFGTNESITHVPCDDPGKLTHVYFIAYIKGSSRPYVNVLSRAQVDKRRARSMSGSSGPWATDYDAMAIKTVIRDSYKYLPKSVEVQNAFDDDGTEPTPAEYVIPAEVEE